MRVCVAAYTFYETDGRVRRYAEALATRGDYVEAFVLGKHGQPARETIRGVHVHRVQKRSRNERGPLSYLLKLLIFFARTTWVLGVRHLREAYDLIHVHSVPDFEVFAAMIPRMLGAQVILDIHDIVPELYASKFKVSENSLAFRLLLGMEKLSVGYAHHVIIANHLWHTKLTRRAANPEKCTVVINYPDPSIFFTRPRTRTPGEDFVLCYPGTLNSHQGLDVAVRAVAILRDRELPVKFLIVGDGPDRAKLRAMVGELGLKDRVTLMGMMPVEAVAETMANVDLGIVPKRSDSFGNEAFSTKILEFMAMGVPVVVSKTRIDRWYFNDNLVQFFEPGNAADLADKILELRLDSARYLALRSSALMFIRQNNWDVKKAEYLHLVDRLAGKTSRPQATPEPA